ncbi:auxin-responsive protein SAUR36 [Cornus florida]|uniref:auxin-responsive protein SAUR36 n=1 Tax=Cornus florida TaxID=4283 RepID=UPI002897D16F|nr:auxin-responsive protein SAUR36 [Cornus florida]
MSRKILGFNLKKRVFKFLRRNPPSAGYRRLDPLPTRKPKLISGLFSCVKNKAKSLCSMIPGRITRPGYTLRGEVLAQEKAVAVPKGQMAVYVGQKGGEFHRVLVPVMYFNHPLFGELLREAEEEYGFNHPGGITIPCRMSDFESVQTRIAAGHGSRKLLTWKNAHQIEIDG